jgi:hypothetical protein
MTTSATCTVYYVTAVQDGVRVEMGKFFARSDANAFAAGLSPRGHREVGVEVREELLAAQDINHLIGPA